LKTGTLVAHFRDLPIRRKLRLTTVTSTTAGLALASGGFASWDMTQFRSAVRQDMTAQSVIIAENSGAALTFGDDRVAGGILTTLRLRPHVDMACLYGSAGVLFTSYRRGRTRGCPSPPPGAARFGWDAFDVVAPVTVDNERIGTLFIRRNLGDMYERLRVFMGTMFGLLVLAVAAAILTGTRMQRSIASPLLQLADTARTISTSRDYSLRATPQSNDEIGTVINAFNEMLDRTVEALERERTANRLKDQFLATLSHELRTPLNAVLGWTRVLRSARLEETAQSKALEAIERNARVQALLIEDLLDMSRIASGTPRLDFHAADLAAIVDASVEVIRPAAFAKRVRLEVEIRTRPAMTHGDSGRLQQVVWNLLSNAIKFTPPEGQVSILLERRGGYRVSVRDTGAGIDASFLPLVFEPFRQADGTITREHGGLGLGLAIAKQLVELHGGTIEAGSAGRGEGATFDVYLPSVIAAPAQGDMHDPVCDALPAMRMDDRLLDGLHVLVVDDEEDARELLATTLTRYGAEVTTAASAATAWTEIERHPPDVLLSDIGMPDQDGYTLVRQLRLRPPLRGGGIPAVAITAYASVNDRLAAESAGYQAHVAKPFEPSEVARLVATLGRSPSSA
jgi:signal transduction histidine kinase/ActR/RegA family two-component response regulator